MTTRTNGQMVLDPSDEVRNQLDSAWIRVLPHRGPLQRPMLIRAQLVWGFKVRSGCLPLNPGTGRAARYGCSRRRGAVTKSPRLARGGQIRLSKSIQFVASRRLKKGDPVGVTWTLKNPKECKQWLLHVVQNSTRYSGSGSRSTSQTSVQWDPSKYVSQPGSLRSGIGTQGARIHLGIPRGSPRNYPQLRDYYEAYRPLGSQSQRTMNLVRSGGHESRPTDTKRRVDTLFSMMSDRGRGVRK